MKHVLVHLKPYRGVMVRERPVEEAREVAASFMNLYYTVYGEQGEKLGEGAMSGVMEVEVRGVARYSPSISGDVVLSCLVEEGAVSRRGGLVVVK